MSSGPDNRSDNLFLLDIRNNISINNESNFPILHHCIVNWYFLSTKWVTQCFCCWCVCYLCLMNNEATWCNCLEPSSGGVIREAGRRVWFHGWHRLMIMGSNATVPWSANHSRPVRTDLRASESWPECRAAARCLCPTPFTLRGIRPQIMAATQHHPHHCH